ncbi:MAG: site-2 protease family protein [Formosimonas sp.]
MDFSEIIYKLSYGIIPIIFAVAFHEAGHAYVAKWLGDDTAHRLGRTTLNPMVHIDPVGTVLLPLATFTLTGFVFGYAKPVPVNASRLRNPAADMPVVALAGLAANALMALIWAILGLVFTAFLPSEVFFQKMASAGIIINLLLFAFNLLPILPLDGGRILSGMLPARMAKAMEPLEQYGMWIIIFLAVSGSNFIGTYWVWPIMDIMHGLIRTMVSPLKSLLGL